MIAENVLGLTTRGKEGGLGESNLDHCIAGMRSIGWWGISVVLDPRLFGFPVSRQRVWILAIPARLFRALNLSPNDAETLVVQTLRQLTAAPAEHRPLDDFLLEETHPEVLQMYQDIRRGAAQTQKTQQQTRRTSSSEGPRSKAMRTCLWPEAHAKQCDRLGLPLWKPLHPSAADFSAFPGLQQLTDREVDLVRNILCMEFPDRPGAVDISQSAGRVLNKASSESTVVTPNGRLYLRHRCRLACGVEALMLQGIHMGAAMDQVFRWPSEKLKDLAGNAFQSWCCGAMLLTSLVVRSLAWQNLLEPAVPRSPPELSRADQRRRAELSLAADAEADAELDKLWSDTFAAPK